MSGVTESSIALAIAARTKLPTLYFSADTNAHTMAMRLVAMAGNMSQQNAEQLLKKDAEKAHELLLSNNHLFWSFESTGSSVGASVFSTSFSSGTELAPSAPLGARISPYPVSSTAVAVSGVLDDLLCVDDQDNWRKKTALILVARQNGKTHLARMLILSQRFMVLIL